MLNTRKLASGQNGAKKLQVPYDDRLLGVRYRYDRQLRKRYKSVELIVKEAEWTPPPESVIAATLVGVRVEFKEADLQRRVKAAGGRWNPDRKPWELAYGKVRKIVRTARIQAADVSANGKPPHVGQQAKLSDSGKSKVSDGGK